MKQVIPVPTGAVLQQEKPLPGGLLGVVTVCAEAVLGHARDA